MAQPGNKKKSMRLLADGNHNTWDTIIPPILFSTRNGRNDQTWYPPWYSSSADRANGRVTRHWLGQQTVQSRTNIYGQGIALKGRTGHTTCNRWPNVHQIQYCWCCVLPHGPTTITQNTSNANTRITPPPRHHHYLIIAGRTIFVIISYLPHAVTQQHIISTDVEQRMTATTLDTVSNISIFKTF